MHNFYFTFAAILCTTLSIGECMSLNNFSEVMASQPRIVGGRPARLGEIPYILSLQSYGTHVCGANFVRDPVGQIDFAVTAAHCVEYASTTGLTLTAGSLSISGGLGQALPVKKIIVHPNYQSWSAVNDIAILFVSGSFRVTKYVKPIALPSTELTSEMVGNELLASGWGNTKERSDYLQVVSLPVVENDLCAESYEPIYGDGSVLDSNICAGELLGGKDTCQGDSGGPLATQDAEPVLVGITSWRLGCTRPKYPGVYTRVSKFVDWIFATVAQNRE